MNQRHRARVVNRRRGIGHAKQRRKSSTSSRGSPGRDGFLGRFPRFAQVHVRVDQAGANNQAAHIDPRCAGCNLTPDLRTHRRNFAIFDQQVGLAIESVRRIYDAPIGEQQ